MEITGMIEVISITVGIGGFVVAFATLWGNSRKETKNETKESVEVHSKLQSEIDVLNKIIGTRLDTIDNGIRDLKADNRSMRADITKLRDDLRDEIRNVHEEAKHAIELSEAAHRRLDRIGAEPDILVHYNEGSNHGVK